MLAAFVRGIVFLGFISTVACSKSDKSNSGSDDMTIPDDITFSEKALPAPSAQDYDEAKTLFKSMSLDDDLEGQLLVPKDESNADKIEREEKFRKLSLEKQNLVLELRSACVLKEDKTESKLPDNPKVGDRASMTSSLEFVGQACPTRANLNSSTRLVLVKRSENPPAVAMFYAGVMQGQLTHTNPAHAQIIGYSQIRLAMNMRGKNEYTNGGTKMFVTTDIAGDADLLRGNYRQIHLQFKIEALAKNDTVKIVARGEVRGGAKTYHLSSLQTSFRNEAPRTRYFFGSRELSAEEMKDLGFPAFMEQKDATKSVGSVGF